ncbi:type II secretion system protein [Gemmatimonadota bacterium]
MNAIPFRGLGRGPARSSTGFTLIELLLVTVVLGILATIVAPYFQQARERAILTLVQADMRQLVEGIEAFSNMNEGRWPTSLEEVESGGSYVPSQGVEYCLFQYVPPRSGRGAYVVALAGHPGTTWKAFTAYPLWGGRTMEYESGQKGC